MASDISLLDSIQIATPCSASWSAMKGDDRVRFCAQCSLHVYNVAAMSQEEAEKLIVETEYRLCSKIYRRYDGTIIASNCPVALRAKRRSLVFGLLWLVFLAMAAVVSVVANTNRPNIFYAVRNKEPFWRVGHWYSPPSPPLVPFPGWAGAPPRNSIVTSIMSQTANPQWNLGTTGPSTRAIEYVTAINQTNEKILKQMQEDYATSPTAELKRDIETMTRLVKSE